MYKAVIALTATTTLALVLAVGTASTVAQERTNDQAVTTATDTRHDDRGFDYGWLGLAGLIGLLGLLPRNQGGSGITVRDGAGNIKDSARR